MCVNIYNNCMLNSHFLYSCMLDSHFWYNCTLNMFIDIPCKCNVCIAKQCMCNVFTLVQFSLNILLFVLCMCKSCHINLCTHIAHVPVSCTDCALLQQFGPVRCCLHLGLLPLILVLARGVSRRYTTLT